MGVPTCTCEVSSDEELCIKNVEQQDQHLSHSCVFRLTCRRSKTRIGVFCPVRRNMYPLTLFVDSDCSRCCEYERRVDLLCSILAPPMAHGNSEDNHLRGERLKGKGDTCQSDSPLAFSQKGYERTWTQRRTSSRYRKTHR